MMCETSSVPAGPGSRRVAVVVPTRNRFDIAEWSIRSVLAAGEPDVAVVVSDNSSSASDADSLRRLCAELAPDGVRYLRATGSLSMTQHWEWALDRVLEDPAIERVAYLTDRMVFSRGELARLLSTVRRVPNCIVSYSHNHVDDLRTPIRCAPAEWSGRLLSIPSATLLQATACGQHPMAIPRMLNSMVPLAVLQAVRERFGSVFASVSPDFAFAFRALATVDSLAFLDRPVLIAHSANRSNGTSVTRGIKSRDALDFDAMTGSSSFPDAPIPELATISNAVFNEYEFVRRQCPERLPALERDHYLARIALDVPAMEDAALAERTARQLAAYGWDERRERQARRRRRLVELRFWAGRPHVLARRWLRRMRGRDGPESITAPTVREAIALLEERPRAANDDALQLIQFAGCSGRVKVLARS